MMGQFNRLPGETHDEWHQRQDRIDRDAAEFELLLTQVWQFARHIDNEAQMIGFVKAWMGIMFKDLGDHSRQYVIKRLKEFEGEMMLERIGGKD